MEDVVLNQRHPTRAMDDALTSLRVVDSRVCQSMLSAPWGLEVPHEPHSSYFVTPVRGRCRVATDRQDRWLKPGDFVLLPHGDRHRITDIDGTTPLPPGALQWDSVRGRCIIDAGGGGERTHIVTGCLVFEASPLLSGLPAMLLLPRGEDLGWQEGIADVLRREVLRPGAGSEVVITHLAGLLVIGAIRRWLQQDDAEGFLQALRQPGLRAALDALHADPTRAWSLEQLARVAAMSRSAFSQRFSEAIGEPPMRYWTRWRMSVAREWLLDERATVDEVADRLGYRSRAAFSRSYKAHTGESPGQTRRLGRAPLRTLNERLTAPTAG